MSNFSHPMVRLSERNPRAEAAGGKYSSIESSMQPRAEMESNIVSSDTMTESPDTDSSDERTELLAAASSPSVSGSPGVRMGVSADAVPSRRWNRKTQRLTYYYYVKYMLNYILK